MLEKLELSPLSRIKKELDDKFGKGAWARWEPETISLQLQTIFSPLMLDKVSLLRILETSPLQAYEDPALFLYAAEVINNNPADFNTVPHLTMLEAAYTIHCIDSVLLANKVIIERPESLKKAVAYILNMDGCSEPLEPLSFVNKEDLSEGQTPSDTQSKKRAIQMYLNYMDSL